VSKLCEHFYETEHRFLLDKTEVLGRESNWRARKVHEAAEIMSGENMVINSLSFDIRPVCRPLIKKLKKWGKNNI
jgi:hypothetical protein